MDRSYRTADPYSDLDVIDGRAPRANQAVVGMLSLVGVVRFRLAEALVVDPYREHRWTGSFILIDEASNDTVGAGMVVSATS